MTPAPTPRSGAEPAGKGPHPSYRRIREKLKELPWRVAAPSCVVPAGVAENCRVLDGTPPLVDEVALVFFESQACLDYGPDDLPPELAGLSLDFSVHLPLDLDWSGGPDAPLDTCLALAAKAAYLSPRSFVLHPPRDLGLLSGVAARWKAEGPAVGVAAPLLLENTELYEPNALAGPAAAAGLGLCLDLGHAMAYGREPAAESVDFGQVGMLHLSAPAWPSREDRHLPLDRLPEVGREILRNWLGRLPRTATLCVEVFALDGVISSLECLAAWAADWGYTR